MAKQPKDNPDWRSGPDALFRAARGDHDASAADFARVEAELARRLAASAPVRPTTEGGGVGPASATSAATLTRGVVAKLGVGVVLLAAGAFATLRFVDSRPMRGPGSDVSAAHSASGPASAVPGDAAANSPREVPTAQVAATPLNVLLPKKSLHREGAPVAQAHPAQRDSAVAPRSAGAGQRTSARSKLSVVSERGVPALPLTAASAAAPPDAAPSAESESAQPRVQPRPSASSSREQPRTSPRVQAVAPYSSAVQESTPAAAELSQRTSPQTQAPSEPTGRGDAADARAELDLVERMNAALRAANPAEALALCKAHAKRWPRGLFIEEREAVRAIASCSLRTHDAAKLATRFLDKHSQAPTADRVAAACAPLLTATNPTDTD